MNAKAKVLLWDIEATNLNAAFGRVLCIGYMWLDEGKAKIETVRNIPAWSKDHSNDKAVVKKFSRILSDADMWVTWYGERYDVPFVQTRLLKLCNTILPNIPHVDLWRTCRTKLKLNNNRLGSACDFFDFHAKTPIRGEQWVRAGAGHKPSLRYVEAHCLADIYALRDAYLKLRPLVWRHPNVAIRGENPDDSCPVCGSGKWKDKHDHLGPKRKWLRYQCGDCGHWEARNA